MKLTKTVSLNGKTVTVSELTVKQIRELWNELAAMSSIGETLQVVSTPFTPQVQALWDACIIGLKPSDLEDYTPGELRVVYDAFAEVNATFLSLAGEAVKANPFLLSLVGLIVNDFLRLYAGSSNVDTETSGDTDTASS